MKIKLFCGPYLSIIKYELFFIFWEGVDDAIMMGMPSPKIENLYQFGEIWILPDVLIYFDLHYKSFVIVFLGLRRSTIVIVMP